MPSKVRIISPRNSTEWDRLVRDTIARRGLRQEEIYGGLTTEEKANSVRRKIRTAARHEGYASWVRYIECPDPGSCRYDRDCAYHVVFRFFTIEEGREYKARQSQQQARTYR